MAINLSSFMATYKHKKTDEEREAFVKEHIVREYVPYEQKADVAKAIVDVCFWRTYKDSSGVERKELYVDSISKYMLICMAIVDLYTDITRQKVEGKMLEDFNTLNKYNVIDLIISLINERELKEFNMVVQMTCDDLMTNEYENHAFIAKQVDRFGELVGAILSPVISQLDMGKIEGLIKEFLEK